MTTNREEPLFFPENFARQVLSRAKDERVRRVRNAKRIFSALTVSVIVSSAFVVHAIRPAAHCEEPDLPFFVRPALAGGFESSMVQDASFEHQKTAPSFPFR